MIVSAATVRCGSCELVQFERKSCRRCGVALPGGVPRVETPASDAALPTLAEAEAALIAEALRRTDGNRAKAAEMIGIGKTTLWRKLRHER